MNNHASRLERDRRSTRVKGRISPRLLLVFKSIIFVSFLIIVRVSDAGSCPLGNPQIKVIDEWVKLPNLNQSDYGGPNDCGPLAAAQMLVYFDAKGTPGIINNPLQNGGVNNQMEDLMQDLYSELPYDGTLGTWDLAMLIGFGDIGEDIKDVAQDRTANANDWNTAESDSVNFNKIKWHMDHDNPVKLLIKWPGNEMYGGFYDGTNVSFHWMPIFASYHRKWGWKNFLSWYSCVDSWALDWQFVAVRTGWVGSWSNDYTWLDYNEFADWYYVRIDDMVEH